jgi:hypothetical protein
MIDSKPWLLAGEQDAKLIMIAATAKDAELMLGLNRF